MTIIRDFIIVLFCGTVEGVLEQHYAEYFFENQPVLSDLCLLDGVPDLT